MSEQQPKKSWAALAQSNATSELKKVTPVLTAASAANANDATELPANANPLLAAALAPENPEDEMMDIEEQWRREPFEAFKQGVAVIFLLWDALQVIIENAFVDEAEKMSDLLEFDLIESFIETRGKIGPEDLETWLQQTIERNFFTIIEDGSTKLTANLICDLYKDIMKKKDFTRLHSLMQQAFDQMGEGEGEGECHVHHIECIDEQDGGDSDYYNEDEDGELEEYDDEDDDEDGDEDGVEEIEEGPQLEEGKANCGPKKQVDEDGWTVNLGRNQGRNQRTPKK